MDYTDTFTLEVCTHVVLGTSIVTIMSFLTTLQAFELKLDVSSEALDHGSGLQPSAAVFWAQ